MAVNRTETAKKFLAKEIEKLSEQERQVVERFVHRGRIARNVAHEFEEQLTAGQRLADRVAEIIGSWRFIIIQACCWPMDHVEYHRLYLPLGSVSVYSAQPWRCHSRLPTPRRSL